MLVQIVATAWNIGLYLDIFIGDEVSGGIRVFLCIIECCLELLLIFLPN